jgi:hypothetical protein
MTDIEYKLLTPGMKIKRIKISTAVYNIKIGSISTVEKTFELIDRKFIQVKECDQFWYFHEDFTLEID